MRFRRHRKTRGALRSLEAEPSAPKRDDLERWKALYLEAEKQRDHWRSLYSQAEQQRDEWRDTYFACEAQRDALRARMEGTNSAFSDVEFNLTFGNVALCAEVDAHLAMRERVFLFGIVYALAPARSLEIGTYKGGSARLISGALDDLARGGKLVTVDADTSQIEIDPASIAHNTICVEGLFPQNVDSVLRAGGSRFDFAFVDGDHRYEGVLADLECIRGLLEPDSYVLLHDAYHPDVARGISHSVDRFSYRDCGVVCRTRNDASGDEVWGGLHLLRAP